METEQQKLEQIFGKLPADRPKSTNALKQIARELRAALWECPVKNDSTVNYKAMCELDRHVRAAFKVCVDYEAEHLRQHLLRKEF